MTCHEAQALYGTSNPSTRSNLTMGTPPWEAPGVCYLRCFFGGSLPRPSWWPSQRLQMRPPSVEIFIVTPPPSQKKIQMLEVLTWKCLLYQCMIWCIPYFWFGDKTCERNYRWEPGGTLIADSRKLLWDQKCWFQESSNIRSRILYPLSTFFPNSGMKSQTIFMYINIIYKIYT